MHMPRDSSSQISDLFIWRNSSEWATYFDLFDIPGLFDDSNQNAKVKLLIFDNKGNLIFKDSIDLITNQVKRIDLSTYLQKASQNTIIGEMGTFSIFHSRAPNSVKNLGSFISERGYLSYKYNNKSIRSYVHGNFDAVKYSSNKYKLIGGSSFFTRQYKLQHELNGPAFYELGITNPTKGSKAILVVVISSKTGNIIMKYNLRLKPWEVIMLPIKLEENDRARLTIESRIVMARPMIFKMSESQLNVFHG